MRHVQRHAALVAILGLIAFLMIGCNTMEGAGEDIESTGESIQDAAD
jgi:predicted small secreted protein